MMPNNSDGRRKNGSPDIDPELAEEAIRQLDQEITLIEEWIADLDRREHPDEATRQARITYQDKLRSRREMREALRINLEQLTGKSR